MLGCMGRPSLSRLPHTNISSKVELMMLGSLSCHKKMTMMAQRCVSTTSADVVISGGGMIGTAAAATIAKLGR